MLTVPELTTEERLSIQMIALSAGVIALVMIVFEFLMPRLDTGTGTATLLVGGDPSFNMIVYGLTSALHILMSLFFSHQLWRGIRKMSPPSRIDKKRKIVGFSTFIFGSILSVAAWLQLDIVTYSHERTLSILRKSDWNNFLEPQIPLTNIAWFSLFPLFLVMCGIIFAVLACMWSAVKASDIIHNQLQKKDFDRDAIWSELSMFSVIVAAVFLTSTIATTFYLSLGRGLAGEDSFGEFYKSSADGMTILWATCFSIIMIIIVLFPTAEMNESARRHHKENRVLGKDTERFSFVYGALSTDRVLKMLAVLFTPVYVAAVRATIS